MSLTPKQKKFCQNVVSGMSYKDAYINAYNNNSEQAAYVEGSKLALRSDIQAEIKALQKPIEQAIQVQELSAKEQQIQEIKERIQVCKDKQDETSLIRYYDMLNKIYGIYKESDTQTNDTTNHIDKLDNETLNKIIRIS